MKSRKYAVNSLWFVLLLLALAIGLSGCEKEIMFMAVPNRAVLALSADDVVQVMSRCGFSDEEIIKYGPGLRSALINSGACQVRQGEIVHAIFAVQGDYVHVSTKMRGSFIYNVRKSGLQSEFRSRKPDTGVQQPAIAPAEGSKGASPLLQTTPTGNTAAPKLQFFDR